MPVLSSFPFGRFAGRDGERPRYSRTSRDPSDRRAASSALGRLPLLRNASCRAAAGSGQGDTLRAAPACGGDLPQDLPGLVLRAASADLRRSLRAVDQPGRPDEHVTAVAGRLRARTRRGHCRPAPGQGRGLRRDRRQDRGLERLPMGVPFGGRRRPPRRTDPRCRRRPRDDGRAPAASLVFGSLFGAAGPWRGASDLPRPSRPGRRLRRRGERRHPAIAAAALAETSLRPGRRHRNLCSLDDRRQAPGPGAKSRRHSPRADRLRSGRAISR